MLVSVVIPCRNEAKRIGPTLDAICSYLNKQDYESEIILVNNSSTDNTKEVARKHAADFKSFRILEENSHGKGWAVRQGMLDAKGDWILMTDADNSTEIGQLSHMLMAGNQGHDVVVSSRRLFDSKIIHPQPFHRRMLGNIFAGMVRLVVPTGVRDTQNGFKLFSAEASEKIFSRLSIFYWAWDIEALIWARHLGYRIKEVPIIWVNDERSGINFKGMVRMLGEVLRMRWNLITGKYKIRKTADTSNRERPSSREAHV